VAESTIKNWGRYCQIIFVRAQQEQGVAEPVWPKAGDQLELRGKTYQFKFYRQRDGKFAVYAPKAKTELAEGKRLVTALQAAKQTEEIDF